MGPKSVARPGPHGSRRSGLLTMRNTGQSRLGDESQPSGGLQRMASKVRISVVPPISRVTTSRSPATPVETMRAPFGSVAVISVQPLRASLATRKDGSRWRPARPHRHRRGQARDQHHPPDPREQGGLFGGRFGPMVSVMQISWTRPSSDQELSSGSARKAGSHRRRQRRLAPARPRAGGARARICRARG